MDEAEQRVNDLGGQTYGDNKAEKKRESKAKEHVLRINQWLIKKEGREGGRKEGMKRKKKKKDIKGRRYNINPISACSLL